MSEGGGWLVLETCAPTCFHQVGQEEQAFKFRDQTCLPSESCQGLFILLSSAGSWCQIFVFEVQRTSRHGQKKTYIEDNGSNKLKTSSCKKYCLNIKELNNRNYSLISISLSSRDGCVRVFVVSSENFPHWFRGPPLMREVHVIMIGTTWMNMYISFGYSDQNW